MVLDLTLLALVWLSGLTAVHRVAPASLRRRQRTQRATAAAPAPMSARTVPVAYSGVAPTR